MWWLLFLSYIRYDKTKRAACKEPDATFLHNFSTFTSIHARGWSVKITEKIRNRRGVREGTLHRIEKGGYYGNFGYWRGGIYRQSYVRGTFERGL
jgi:hypothetical protein